MPGIWWFKLERSAGLCRRSRAGIASVTVLLQLLAVFSTAWPVTAQDQGGSESYGATILASYRPGIAATADSGLVDPWGMAKGPSGPWWIAEEARGHLARYGGNGSPLPALSPFALMLSPPPGGISDDATPTGVVLNDTDDFGIAPGTPSRLLAVTRDGAIMAWSGAYEDSPELMIDNAPEAIYTGAAIGRYQGQHVLYVANLGQGRVEVYDDAFLSLQLGTSAFTDPLVPSGYGPYNVQLVSGYVVVTFAKLNSAERDAAPDPGSGYVDVFESDGSLILRLQHGEWLNAPWGIADAPLTFGVYGGTLLIGNNGSGTIAAFDKASGNFLGYLSGPAGTPLVIPGLHALSFGNNGLAGPSSALFFSAGFAAPRQGAFGVITPGSPVRGSPPLPGSLSAVPAH